jgi:hypothetical protein
MTTSVSQILNISFIIFKIRVFFMTKKVNAVCLVIVRVGFYLHIENTCNDHIISLR